nr:phage late control D family protein [Burkholderia anthina]
MVGPALCLGRACLGRDFEFTIDITSTRLEAIRANALIRQSVTLWIRQTNGSEMPIHGYVTAFSRSGADGANTYYQLRFNSFLALLRLGSDRRDWIETPAQQTVSDVLGKYPQASGNVTWQVRQALRSYSQRMQWESDWNYVHRTFEELGLFPRFDIAKDGKSHKVVIMDDLFSVPELMRKNISFSGAVQDEEFDGLGEWIDSQEIQSAELDTGTFDYKRPDLSKHVTMPAFDLDDVPGLGEQYEYTGSHTWSDRDMGENQANFIAEEWRSRAQRFYGVGALRCAWPGRYGVLTGHPVHDAQSEQDREMAILSVNWLIQNNVPGIENLTRFRKSLRAEVEQARATGTGSAVRHDWYPGNGYRASAVVRFDECAPDTQQDRIQQRHDCLAFSGEVDAQRVGRNRFERRGGAARLNRDGDEAGCVRR